MEPRDLGRLTDVDGVAVGHWTDPVALTGCTVVLLSEGTVASGEVRGGGPASRELALLEPHRHVTAIDAVVLTGGSAFGLAAADGVMHYLEARGRGYVTTAGRVPIVPTLAVFDLAVGDASVRPGPDQGRAAAEGASTDHHEVGLIGAGTGCTTDKWRGPDQVRRGGLVAASAQVGDATVACLIAVNALGSVGAASSLPEGDLGHPILGRPAANDITPGTNTTIGVVATSARLDKAGCHLLAESAHDGLARAIFPTHTRFDGDAFVACATGRDGSTGGDDAAPGIDALRTTVTTVVERAITSLVV